MNVVGKTTEKGTTKEALWFHCPGCKSYHRIPVGDGHEEGRWKWNGSLEKPTISPSYNYPKVCHFFIKEGRIEFCGDCAHDLSGQTVEMEEWKEWGEGQSEGDE